MPARKVLVFLDCLLDTRIGTLAKLDPKYRDHILNNKTIYFDRVCDEFDWIEPGLTARYREAYAKRDVETLKASFRTLLPDHLRMLSIATVVDGGESPLWDRSVYEVSYWPYDLDSELINAFQEALTELLTVSNGKDVFEAPEVKMVNVSLADVTFQRVKDDWDAVYIYDFQDWTDTHAKAFKNPENEMVAIHKEFHVPTLFRDYPDKDQLKLPDGNRINPFDETKKFISLWLNLNFVNPRYFCIPDPFKLEEAIRKSSE